MGGGLVNERIRHTHNTPCDVEQIKGNDNNCLEVQERELAQWAGLIREAWSRGGGRYFLGLERLLEQGK